MLEGGEDPRFIVRRMVVLASEDIGNADPQALVVATAAAAAVEHVGLPECQFALAQAAIYLSLAPKSDAAKRAVFAAREHIRERGAEPPPPHLRSSTRSDGGYDNPHHRPGHVSPQELLPGRGDRRAVLRARRRRGGAARAARADPPRPRTRRGTSELLPCSKWSATTPQRVASPLLRPHRRRARAAAAGPDPATSRRSTRCCARPARTPPTSRPARLVRGRPPPPGRRVRDGAAERRRDDRRDRRDRRRSRPAGRALRSARPARRPARAADRRAARPGRGDRRSAAAGPRRSPAPAGQPEPPQYA